MPGISISIHPLSVCLLWGHGGFGGFCLSQSQLSMGKGSVHLGQVASSSQGPLIGGAHQEQFGVQYLAHGHFDMQPSTSQPATFQSLADLLYPLSHKLNLQHTSVSLLHKPGFSQGYVSALTCSGVRSLCSWASISYPTMNFLTVAERSRGG